MHAICLFERRPWLVLFGAICACSAAAPTDAASADNLTTSGSAVGVPFGADSDAVTLGRVVVGSRASQTDLSATYRARNDGANLYVTVDVNDDARANDSAEAWNDDAIELYFDMAANGGTNYDANDFHWLVRAADASVTSAHGSIAGVTAQTSAKSGGYRVAVTIPWSTLGKAPAAGLVFGFEVMVDDDDDGGGRDAQLAWASPDANAYASPDRFGRATLGAPGAPGRPPSKAACESIVAHGAIPNGPDATAAIKAAIAAAQTKAARCVYVPAGRYAITKLTADGVRLVGDGDASVLYGPNPANRQIDLAGANAGIYSLQIATNATGRTNTNVGVNIQSGASSFVVDDVTIDGSNGAGIITYGGHYGRITHNRVRNTKADAIHMSGGANHIYVAGNTVENAGDDMVAVVTYQYQPVLTNEILVENNRLLSQTGGRGMTVVGGERVTMRNNVVTKTAAAGVYLAAESSYVTWGVKNVRVENNTIDHAPFVHPETGHDAILVYSGNTMLVEDVYLEGNAITNAPNGPIDVRPRNVRNVACAKNTYAGAPISPASCGGDPGPITGTSVTSALLGGTTVALP